MLIMFENGFVVVFVCPLLLCYYGLRFWHGSHALRSVGCTVHDNRRFATAVSCPNDMFDMRRIFNSWIHYKKIELHYENEMFAVVRHNISFHCC